MQNLTLDQMIQETATYVDEDIGSSPYSGDVLKIVNKIVSGINYAYIKTSKEKWKPFVKESVVVGVDNTVDTTSFTNTFNGVRKITDVSGNEIKYSFVDSITLEMFGASAGDTVYFTYYYIPDELSVSDLTAKIIQPNGAIDNKILCFYGAYHYLTTENDAQASYWLNLFNDGFDSITQQRGEIMQVKSETGW